MPVFPTPEILGREDVLSRRRGKHLLIFARYVSINMKPYCAKQVFPSDLAVVQQGKYARRLRVNGGLSWMTGQ